MKDLHKRLIALVMAAAMLAASAFYSGSNVLAEDESQTQTTVETPAENQVETEVKTELETPTEEITTEKETPTKGENQTVNEGAIENNSQAQDSNQSNDLTQANSHTQATEPTKLQSADIANTDIQPMLDVIKDDDGKIVINMEVVVIDSEGNVYPEDTEVTNPIGTYNVAPFYFGSDPSGIGANKLQLALYDITNNMVIPRDSTDYPDLYDAVVFRVGDSGVLDVNVDNDNDTVTMKILGTTTVHAKIESDDTYADYESVNVNFAGTSYNVWVESTPLTLAIADSENNVFDETTEITLPDGNAFEGFMFYIGDDPSGLGENILKLVLVDSEGNIIPTDSEKYPGIYDEIEYYIGEGARMITIDEDTDTATMTGTTGAVTVNVRANGELYLFGTSIGVITEKRSVDLIPTIIDDEENPLNSYTFLYGDDPSGSGANVLQLALLDSNGNVIETDDENYPNLYDEVEFFSSNSAVTIDNEEDTATMFRSGGTSIHAEIAESDIYYDATTVNTANRLDVQFNPRVLGLDESNTVRFTKEYDGETRAEYTIQSADYADGHQPVGDDIDTIELIMSGQFPSAAVGVYDNVRYESVYHSDESKLADDSGLDVMGRYSTFLQPFFTYPGEITKAEITEPITAKDITVGTTSKTYFVDLLDYITMPVSDYGKMVIRATIDNDAAASVMTGDCILRNTEMEFTTKEGLTGGETIAIELELEMQNYEYSDPVTLSINVTNALAAEVAYTGDTDLDSAFTGSAYDPASDISDSISLFYEDSAVADASELSGITTVTYRGTDKGGNSVSTAPTNSGSYYVDVVVSGEINGETYYAERSFPFAITPMEVEIAPVLKISEISLSDYKNIMNWDERIAMFVDSINFVYTPENVDIPYEYDTSNGNMSNLISHSSDRQNDLTPGTCSLRLNELPDYTGMDGTFEFNYTFTLADVSYEVVADSVTIAPPTASPKGGTYSTAQTVTLTSADDYEIRYTTNGTTPTAINGTIYTAPIVISRNTTLKAVAVNNGVLSNVMTEVYTIGGGTVTPVNPGDNTGNNSDDDSGDDPSDSTSSSNGNNSSSTTQNDTSTVSGNTTVSGDTATTTVTTSRVETALENALEVNEEAPVVTLNLSELTSEQGVEAIVPTSAITALTEANAVLEITAGEAVITFDNDALATILAESGDTGSIQFNFNFANTAELTSEVSSVVSDRPVYEFTVTYGDKVIRDFKGKVNLSIPYAPRYGENQNSIIVFNLAEDGSLTLIPNASYNPENGKVNFTTTHFSFYTLGYNHVTFNDINEHWAKAAIEYSAARKLVTGTGNNLYEPSRSVTRAEFTVMMLNVLAVPYEKATTTDWFSAAENTAKKLGLYKGLLDGNMTDNITREEMTVIIANAAEYAGLFSDSNVDIKTKYSDYSEITTQYIPRVRAVIELGIMSGQSENTFVPKGETTRAEAAQIQRNFLEAMK